MNHIKSNNQQGIQCSVGILTFNSAKTLERTLESVKDFSEIIIADGGSTDSTLDIGHKYGATIIDQYTKHHPGSEPKHPIEDFARERNLLLEKARYDWFFWIDSDEYISKELHDEIAEVVTLSEVNGCQIQMILQSPDGTQTYRLPSPICQTRLVRKSAGEFKRPIHERFTFRVEEKIKKLQGAWYVPFSKPDFATYKWAVNYRLRKFHENNPPKSFRTYAYRAWYRTPRRVLGVIVRMVRSYLTIPFKEIPPWYYFRNRLYSQWVTFKILNQLYFGKNKYD